MFSDRLKEIFADEDGLKLKASRRIPVKLERYAIKAMRVAINSAALTENMGRNGRDEHGGGAGEGPAAGRAGATETTSGE